MIVNLFTVSPMLQMMIALILSLAAFSVAGLVYPIVRGRGYEEGEAEGESGKGYQHFYGTKETLERLKKIRESGEFSEGIIIGYRALRNLLPKVHLLSENKTNTELEIISELIRTSPELHEIAQSIFQAYEYYEKARFSKPLTAEEFNSAIATFDKVYSNPTIKRRRMI